MSADTPRRVYLHRLGCPKLDVDHDLLTGGLVNMGAEFVDSADAADTVVVSTCAFIGDAREEAVDAMLEAARWKQEGPEGRRVYVTGCMPARYKDALEQELPEVDGFFGPGEFAGLLERMDPERAKVLLDEAGRGPSRHPGRMARSLEDVLSRLRMADASPVAYLKIAEGCDRRCAYCAIPTIRGRYTSRRPGSILSEADRLLNQGVREIIVTAEEVNSYGRDLGGDTRIETLLPRLGEKVARHEGWLRVLYTHPPIFREEFVQALADTPALVPYLDFPIEHADDRVLRSMGRGTTWERMQHWIARLRESIEDIALRTSVIVGHPGEGPEEFHTLLARLDAARFERLGVFRYSPEEGTRAAGLDAPGDEELERREIEVMELALDHAEDWYADRVGRPAEVLVEGRDEGGRVFGRSIWDAPDVDGDAVIEGDAGIGEIVPGVVTAAEPFTMTVQMSRPK